jgi:nucleoside-diphosphate-sugar epimerase
MSVLVTGATGFVGAAVRDALRERGLTQRGTSRSALAGASSSETVVVGELDGGTDWDAALEGVSVVVHLAARVHVMRETASDPLTEFRRVNTWATEHLARSAAARGARRFVYVSTIKVNGEATASRPFSGSDAARPSDPYGISKWEAELALARVAEQTGLEVVIVRPPLVYGAGVRGNFFRLLRLAHRGVPLPLGGAHNRRSLLFVRNLADALVTCATHPTAAGNTFLVSDGEDLSTKELYTRLALALGNSPRLVSVPPSALRLLARVTRRQEEFQRLFGSLQVDAGAISSALQWRPPYTVDQGIRETASWFLGR